MKIYYSEITDLSAADSAYPGLSGSRGSALAMSLLAYACRDFAKWYLPPHDKLIFGRSLLSGVKQLSYSVSHSRTHVVAAVADHPLGVDTEPKDRRVSQRLIDGVATPEELESFSFMELWCLKESYFKYKREGDVRAMRFEKRQGLIIGPENGVCFKLCDDIDGAVCAVCSPRYDFPRELIHVPAKLLCRKA